MGISIFGLGKVGLSLAACLAAAGRQVIGVDPDAERVAALDRGTFHSDEPGVMERLARGAGRLRATTEAAEAVAASRFSFIIVPTPSNTLGGFSLRHVLEVCDRIGAALRRRDGGHVVAVVSTLLPGSSDHTVIPRLQQASGRRIGGGLGYCYNPSFIALGDVVRGLEEPDYVLIGEADARSGEAVLEVHRGLVRNDAPVARMTPAEAEITKLASNTHETLRVSFANMLLAACSEVPGADVDRITEALAHRIGRRFLRGAVPYGGPCWPRDNDAFAAFLDGARVSSRLPRAVHLFNQEHGRYVLSKVLAHSRAGQTVGLLGLAYKPGTPVVDHSFALELARGLLRERRRIVGWDPLPAAAAAARRQLGDALESAESAEACLRAAQTAVVVNPMPELDEIDWSAGRHCTVLDGWRAVPAAPAGRLGGYVALGRGPRETVEGWLRRTLGKGFELLIE